MSYEKITEHRLICDRCRASISLGKNREGDAMVSRPEEWSSAHLIPGKDLCPGCSEGFRMWWRAPDLRMTPGWQAPDLRREPE